MISKREIPQIKRDFRQFCNIDLQHKDNTAHKRTLHIQHFLTSLNSSIVTRETIREYLKKYRSMSSYTYKNVLCSLRIFFNNYLGREDLIKTFRFPKINETPIIAPAKEELQKLHEALDTKYKAILLMYATTGLRESELLSLTFDNIDLNRQMIIPKKRSRTKTTWITFFNEEAKNALIEYLSTRQDDDPRLFPVKRCSVGRMLKKVSNRLGSNISPQRLRDWFCVEMGELGVPDRYIDAFCGRVPKSILARHYTDYSPQRLKRIYNKANLRLFS